MVACKRPARYGSDDWLLFLANFSSCLIVKRQVLYLQRLGRKAWAVGEAGGSHFQGVDLVLITGYGIVLLFNMESKRPFLSMKSPSLMVHMLLSLRLYFNAV